MNFIQNTFRMTIIEFVKWLVCVGSLPVLFVACINFAEEFTEWREKHENCRRS